MTVYYAHKDENGIFKHIYKNRRMVEFVGSLMPLEHQKIYDVYVEESDDGVYMALKGLDDEYFCIYSDEEDFTYFAKKDPKNKFVKVNVYEQ